MFYYSTLSRQRLLHSAKSICFGIPRRFYSGSYQNKKQTEASRLIRCGNRDESDIDRPILRAHASPSRLQKAAYYFIFWLRIM